MASRRLTRSAFSAIKASTPCLSRARARAISASAYSLRNSLISPHPPPNFNRVAENNGGLFSLIRSFNSSTPRYSSASSPAQINQSDYTDMAWEGLVGAVEATRDSKQQMVEPGHLMKSLLEQKDGLARRIFTKAGLDNTSVLHATDDFISKQPKVIDTSNPVMGSYLSSLLDNSRKHKKEMGDNFVSVEHFILAFMSYKRFRQQLFKNLQFSEQALKDAVKAVCGNQRVTDQNPEGKYEALDKYGNDLTELARRGKLDPVIGRDDEIRWCIQILSRRTKNNPVIIGEPGVGKTAIAEGGYNWCNGCWEFVKANAGEG